MDECEWCGVRRFMLEGVPRYFHPFICSEECYNLLYPEVNIEEVEPEKIWISVECGLRQKDGMGLGIWSYGIERPDQEVLFED